MRRRVLVWVVFAALLIGIVSPAGVQAAEPRVPLLLLHGLLGSPETTWSVALPWFEERGYVAGETLFTVDLQSAGGESVDLGLLSDAAFAAGEVRRILGETGAAQVDLFGGGRGGLVVRLLTSGDTTALVRRAVTLDAPHAGVLSKEAMAAMLDFAGVDSSMAETLPADLQAGGVTLRTMKAREDRFADRKVAALAIGTTWRDGHHPALAGHDGLVPLQSQLAWPGAATAIHQIGVTPEKLAADLAAGLGPLALIPSIPHIISVEQAVTLAEAYAFFSAPEVVAPVRFCEPNCQDWTLLQDHWSLDEVRALLPDRLPYDLDAKGQRIFAPNRSATRSEFVYGLAKALSLPEQLGPTKFADLLGHWSLGYVQAAVAAKLVVGKTTESFGSDDQLTRAEAATLIVRAKKLPLSQQPSRFADARDHWAAANIEAAAEAGILKGDERGFRPDDPVTMAEAAVILSRSFPR